MNYTEDYTISLPYANKMTGGFINIRIDTANTKIITIARQGTDLIDGLTSRKMWAGESALLYSDGTNWHKLSGLSKPMYLFLIANAASTSVVTATETAPGAGLANALSLPVINFSTTAWTFSTKRAGLFSIHGAVEYLSFPADKLCGVRITVGGAVVLENYVSNSFIASPIVTCSGSVYLSAGDSIALKVYHAAGENASITNDASTKFIVSEHPIW
jgi:hypothetical protein